MRVRRIRPMAAASFACLLGLLVGTSAHSTGDRSDLHGLPPELRSRLFDKGWLILQEVDPDAAGLSGGYLLAYVVFEKPRDEVFALLAESERQIEYRPELRKIQVVESLPDGQVDEHRIKIMLMKIVYRLRFKKQPAEGRIDWELDARFDNDLERVQGFWELHSLDDGRTFARFGTVVDVGPALPTSIQDMVTRRKLPDTIESCRRWVDSGGTYRP